MVFAPLQLIHFNCLRRPYGPHLHTRRQKIQKYAFSGNFESNNQLVFHYDLHRNLSLDSMLSTAYPVFPVFITSSLHIYKRTITAKYILCM